MSVCVCVFGCKAWLHLSCFRTRCFSNGGVVDRGVCVCGISMSAEACIQALDQFWMLLGFRNVGCLDFRLQGYSGRFFMWRLHG